MAEAAAIGAAIGCPIAQSAEDRMAVTRKLGAFKTSMLQDVEAGRPVEIDALRRRVREIGAAGRRADAEHRRAARACAAARARARAVLTHRRCAKLSVPSSLPLKEGSMQALPRLGLSLALALALVPAPAAAQQKAAEPAPAPQKPAAEEEPFWAVGRPKGEAAMRMAPVPAFPVPTAADKLPVKQDQAAARLQGRGLGQRHPRCARHAPGRQGHGVRELAVRRRQDLRGAPTRAASAR